jgi:hypothetical protein
MGTLANHDTQVSTSSDDKTVTSASSTGAGSSSKHHSEPRDSRGKNSSTAGMGSDRLPSGKLDSSRTL